MVLQSLFEKHECYVLVPTYNNATLIGSVLDEVLHYTNRVVVVNDGSTDYTEEVLKRFPSVKIISYAKNKGKGYAIRQGFAYLQSIHAKYVITIDSDGQHKASDFEAFLNQIPQSPAAIMMGARDMTQSNVPGKSSFGNKFSNFWFRLQTGIDMPDTQTGYRLYPLYLMKDISLITNKYELEIEVIVKSAWKNIEVVAVPIDVYYPPQEERISHFRPFKDFSRISVLNTWLTTLAIIYYIPKRYIQYLFSKSVKEHLKDVFLAEGETALDKSKAVGLGLFMGIAPVWGYQLLIGFSLAHLLKLNKSIFFISANISFPPFIPFVIYFSLHLGQWLTKEPLAILSKPILSYTLNDIGQSLYTYVVGAVSLASVVAIVGMLVSYVLFKLMKIK